MTAPQPFTVVLGVAQDAGHPQAACTKACCADAWDGAGHLVSCLGIVDPVSGERWMLDATPDFRSQLRQLDLLQPPRSQPDLAGVMLTHAHMGHYTGLLHLGREAIGADAVADIWSTTALAESYASDGSTGTGAQLLYQIQQALTEFAISSTTLTVKKLDGSTTASTYTLDDASAPTSRTRAS